MLLMDTTPLAVLTGVVSALETKLLSGNLHFLWYRVKESCENVAMGVDVISHNRFKDGMQRCHVWAY